jgi:hypothetical protein
MCGNGGCNADKAPTASRRRTQETRDTDATDHLLDQGLTLGGPVIPPLSLLDRVVRSEERLSDLEGNSEALGTLLVQDEDLQASEHEGGQE